MKPTLTLLTSLLLAPLATWMDCNAIFLGVSDFAEQAKQLAGNRVAMPEIQ